MKTALIVLTAVELVALVIVLAGYLIAIAATLRTVSRTLGLVTFGVRAIEKQTEPVGPLLGEVNAELRRVADALGARSRHGEGPVEGARVEPATSPETGGT